MELLSKTNKIQVICPICKTVDIVGIPPSRLNKKTQLTTISVHKGLICPHHFQFFMDKNFQIRGYQKVDLELSNENSKKLRNGIKAFNVFEKENNDLFKKLILDGDEIKYKSLNKNKNREESITNRKVVLQRKKMSLKEIYEEFWEFIDDNNEIFLKFIIEDEKRGKSSFNSRNYLTIQN